MELVFEKAQCDERVYIEQISHGRFERMSSTCALDSCGARSPALRTGRPVTVSRPMVALAGRARRGVRTICPLFTQASRASPGLSRSFRRIGPGRTTCPLLEMRVCMVRVSYRARALGHNTTVEPRRARTRRAGKRPERGDGPSRHPHRRHHARAGRGGGGGGVRASHGLEPSDDRVVGQFPRRRLGRSSTDIGRWTTVSLCEHFAAETSVPAVSPSRCHPPPDLSRRTSEHRRRGLLERLPT